MTVNKVAPNPGSKALILGGWLSVLAALLHVGCIIGGPDWYRFFGAGDEMALAAERGAWFPAVMTMGIATILGIWAAFAFSGTGRILRLPLLRAGLVVISAIYLLRGLILIPLYLMRPDLTDSFAIWSSLIVFIHGLAYAVGTWRAWPALSKRD